MDLNLEQRQAVATDEGVFLVMATAGSGKTTVLTQKVLRLLDEGVSPSEILALTFTKNAAENMKERLGLKIPTTEKHGFRNFHSFGLRVILNEMRFLPFPVSQDPVPEGNIASKIITTAMRAKGVAGNEFKDVKNYISRMKQERLSPEQALANLGLFDSTVYAEIYDAYEKGMRAGRYIDRDDMILWSVYLLEIPEVRAKYQFKFVLADEVQDTDDSSFRLLQLVSERHGNLFLVGDEMQSLYKFRGARPQNLTNIREWFPTAQTLILPENFRSSAVIVRYSQKHAPIDNELSRAMRTANPEGDPIEFRMFATPETEAESALVAADTDPQNSAILARTNAQIAVVENICETNDVKFQLLGECGYWNQPEVRTVVNLIGFILGGKEPNGYQQDRVTDKGIVASSKAVWAVKEIVRLANLDELYSHDDYAAESNFALRNLRSLEKKAERFDSLREFKSFTARAAAAARNNKKGITLGTIHAAKGLEWSNVFLIGVAEESIPHANAGEAEEPSERNVFYVGISRPAKKLRISFCGRPSPYIISDLTPEIVAGMKAQAKKVEVLERQLSLI